MSYSIDDEILWELKWKIAKNISKIVNSNGAKPDPTFTEAIKITEESITDYASEIDLSLQYLRNNLVYLTGIGYDSVRKWGVLHEKLLRETAYNGELKISNREDFFNESLLSNYKNFNKEMATIEAKSRMLGVTDFTSDPEKDKDGESKGNLIVLNKRINEIDEINLNLSKIEIIFIDFYRLIMCHNLKKITLSDKFASINQISYLEEKLDNSPDIKIDIRRTKENFKNEVWESPLKRYNGNIIF